MDCEEYLALPDTIVQSGKMAVLDDDGRFQAALPDAQGRFHSRIIPGFFVQLEWLWQEPAPSTFVVAPQLASENPAFADACSAWSRRSGLLPRRL